MSTVIFDLDGTITDPAEGITRSINYALVQLGFEPHPEEELQKYIGPHLNTTFSELMGAAKEDILLRAIELYLERYIRIGYRENRLYDGMREMLYRLSSNGSSLCIATSKRRDLAVSVLKFFGLGAFFAQVHGCGLYRSKSDLLRDILSDETLTASPMVMIGDRATDFLSAAAVGMPSIGVRWGFGTEDELALAMDVVTRPSELPEAIERNAKPM